MSKPTEEEPMPPGARNIPVGGGDVCSDCLEIEIGFQLLITMPKVMRKQAGSSGEKPTARTFLA